MAEKAEAMKREANVNLANDRSKDAIRKGDESRVGGSSREEFRFCFD